MCDSQEKSLADLSKSVSFALRSKKKKKPKPKIFSPFDSGVVSTIRSYIQILFCPSLRNEILYICSKLAVIAFRYKTSAGNFSSMNCRQHQYAES